MSSISTLLEVEIADKMEELNSLKLGTDEYKTAVESITKVMDRLIEIDKFEVEATEKEEGRKDDTRIKEAQLKDDKKHRWIDKAINVGTFVGMTVLTVWGTNKTLKFEETGTVTTIAGKQHINKLFSFIRK